MQDWQRELPIHKESVLAQTEETRMLFVSRPFMVKTGPGRQTEVQAKVWATWSSRLNKINQFHLREEVISCATGRVSEYANWCDVPESILAQIPEAVLRLRKWNGCSTAGPWSYIQSTVWHAGDKDCWGLQKGQHKQILFGGKKDQPCWELVAISPEGWEMSVHQVTYNSSCHGAKPTGEWRLEWRPSWKVGEGKTREFDFARSSAIWPEATEEDLTDPFLMTKLRQRLPGLLAAMRKDVEALGFTW